MIAVSYSDITNERVACHEVSIQLIIRLFCDLFWFVVVILGGHWSDYFMNKYKIEYSTFKIRPVGNCDDTKVALLKGARAKNTV